PYLIYKKYNNQKYLSLFDEMLGVNLSGFTNLCMLFLLKSLTELNPGGRMAYIIPSEFMNADYGKEIKQIIKDYINLKYVILLNYNLFEVNTTSAIFLFSNELNQYDDNNGQIEENDHLLKFFSVDSREELEALFYKNELKGFSKNGCSGDNKCSSSTADNEVINSKGSKSKTSSNEDVKNRVVIAYQELDPVLKWRFYYQKMNSSKYKNLVEFSEYARVLRGIATGANEFFLFNKSKQRKYQIADKYLMPCISRASHIKGHFSSVSHFKDLCERDKNVYLLDLYNKELDCRVEEYIKHGENKGYHQRYLTRYRKPWYRLENKPSAPILARVFNRTGLKFVINEANLYNLTAFHCIYINSEEYADLLKAYLLTETATSIIEDNRREYGDGLSKLEPNDINKSLMLNLKIINQDDRKRIYSLYRKYRTVDSADLLKQLNKVFLKYM
ncbi:MAG: Eco57I restriction-modification methylase domain-containing protein, partial [Halanaerobiales bacterium]